MTFSYRRLFFGGTTFCWCLPVRMGVISMSFLGLLVAGLLTVILWFEVASPGDMAGDEEAAFILAGLTETILFAASILGLVGAIVQKQSFTQTYAYILYVHFIVNVGVAVYLLYEVTRTTQNADDLACKTAIQDPQAQNQCSGVLSIARWVYVAVAGTVLLVEMYGAIIVTRYLNQLKVEKGALRAMRLDTENAFELKRSTIRYQYARLPSPAMLPPLDSSGSEFNPYEDAREESNVEKNEIYTDRPALPIDAGYGGGSWTHEGIADEEKARLSQKETLDEPSLPREAVLS